MVSEIIKSVIDGLVVFATDLLYPAMGLLFVGAVIGRALIYYTIKREEWFARQFEVRVDQFVAENRKVPGLSFYVISKRLLEKTFYELFEVQAYLKMKKPDMIMTVSDRLFLIKQGAAWFVHDILKQIKLVKHDESAGPKIFQISKNTFSRNPCFNKVLGIFPTGTFNDLLNMLPSIFIVLGIFGTFLGIMKALPNLGDMNLNDIEGTKMVMDQFLMNISFSMGTSILGIVLSISLSFLNTTMSPSKIFLDSVDRLESSLDSLWNLSDNNHLPDDLPEFNEHRDPIEALAEQSVQRQITYSKYNLDKNSNPSSKQAA